MKTSLTIKQAEKIVADTLAETQLLIKDIPHHAGMIMTVEQTTGGIDGYKFYFKFKLNNKGMATSATVPMDDYWFTWLKSERQEKLVAYAYDSYNYIMRKLFPGDLMFIELPPRLLM